MTYNTPTSTHRNDLLFWRQGNNFVAKMGSHLTERIQLNGRSLKVGGSLGDYDILRSETHAMVGLVFGMSKGDLKLVQPIIEGLDSVRINLPAVHFYLSPCSNPETQLVQGSSWIYYDGRKAVAIAVHEWVDWGLIGFPLISDTTE